MKKLLSLVCVLALALALCVPAFAEDATAGQTEEPTAPTVFPEDPASNPTAAADYVYANPTDYEAAKTLTTVLSTQGHVDSKASSAMYWALCYARNRQEVTVNSVGGSVSVMHVSGSALNAVVNTAANNTLKLEFSFADGGQSDLGAYIGVTLPAGSLDTTISYKWVNDAGQTGFVGVPGTDAQGNVTLQFYAPHFSVYAIVPADEGTPAPSILAKTNADLNMTAAVLAVLALATTAGCAVVLKKRALDK